MAQNKVFQTFNTNNPTEQNVFRKTFVILRLQINICFFLFFSLDRVFVKFVTHDVRKVGVFSFGRMRIKTLTSFSLSK